MKQCASRPRGANRTFVSVIAAEQSGAAVMEQFKRTGTQRSGAARRNTVGLGGQKSKVLSLGCDLGKDAANGCDGQRP
jgi:hypothetical protein